MQVMSNITNEEISKLVKNSRGAEAPKSEPEEKKINTAGLDDLDTPPIENISDAESRRRNILLIGCGDGGCNIAAEVKKKMPDNIGCILYNTSPRAMEKHLDIADVVIVPKTEDGSGKDRNYSKDVFRKGHFKTLLSEVNTILSKKSYDYIIVTTTTDGGTGGGASPNIAKFLSGNTELPVIILGVLPTLAEDAKAQYNALAWQADVEKTGLPHIIFDNNAYEGNAKLVVHLAINREIAKCMEVLTGTAYGDTTISSIDNRDMLMILMNAGKRVVVDTTEARPSVSDNFDDFIMQMLNDGFQPMPKNATAIGIFVKGPKQFIETVDTSLLGVRSKIGNGQMYTHIEEAEQTRISIIAAGCTSYDERMLLMRQRYDDVVNSVNVENTSANDFLDGMKNPFETKIQKQVLTKEVDTSALDI